MSEALREGIVDLGGTRTKEEITGWINTHYKGRWADGTLRDHLYGGRVNHPLAYRHHPGQKKFLFDHGDHRYELYDQRKHGAFHKGKAVASNPLPGWILIHSRSPKDYGKFTDYPSPMAQLDEEDAENSPGLLWHWKLRIPPTQGSQPRRLLFAWKGEVFGEGIASITHKSQYKNYSFAFVLHSYEPLDKPVSLSKLPLGGRDKNNRGLIRLDERILAAFDSQTAKRPWTKRSPEGLETEELIDLITNPEQHTKANRRRLFQSVEARKCIEERAMKVAEAYLESEGFLKIKDVSKSEPFDFTATREARKFIIEVKGTTGSGSEIILTRNEVRRHQERHPNNILIVVHSIALDRTGPKPKATKGVPKMSFEWVIVPERLAPLSYSYRV